MKLIKNYLYNASYQLLALILPLITGPYVSRVLGPVGVGVNTYTYNIANWFVLVGSIGVGLYGNQQVAYARGNQKKLSQCFWEIFIMKEITIVLSFIIFIMYILLVGRYKQYQLIQSVYIIAAGLDISWFFMGIEDFKRIVLRNFFIKLISLLLILTLVKNKNDLFLYLCILSFATLFGNLTLWPFLRGELVSINWHFLNPFKHFSPAVALFIPLAAIQIYTGLNKVMLGYFDSTIAAGFYDKSDVVVKMTLTIATSLGTVLMPHSAKIFGEGNMEKVRELLYRSFSFISLISVPLAFGLAAISFRFGRWFYGSGFEKVGLVMFLESFVIIIIAWASITGNQYLVPTNQISVYTHSVLVGAVVNIVLCIPMIHFSGLYGAMISMVIAETTVTLYQILAIRNQINLKKLFDGIGKFMFAGFLMFIPIFYLNLTIQMTFISLVAEIILGICIYIGTIFVIHPPILDDIILFFENKIAK